MTRLTRLISQCLFGVAAVLACLAVWEWVVEIFHRELRFLQGYQTIRLIELAAVALLFVITLQLWEIKRLPGTPED
jgi:hypothetical protein